MKLTLEEKTNQQKSEKKKHNNWNKTFTFIGIGCSAMKNRYTSPLFMGEDNNSV